MNEYSSKSVEAFIANELAHIDHHAQTLRVFGVSFVTQLLTIHIAGLVAALGLRPTELGSKIVAGSPQLYTSLLLALAVGAVAALFVKVFIFVLSFAKLRSYRDYLQKSITDAELFGEKLIEKLKALDWSNGPTKENGKVAEILAYISFTVAAASLVVGVVIFMVLVLSAT